MEPWTLSDWRQGRIIQRHDAIRDLFANTLNALEEVTVVSTEPTLHGEGGHGQRGDIKLLANGTEFVVDVTVACPATRHMTRTHHTGTVPGAAGQYERNEVIVSQLSKRIVALLRKANRDKVNARRKQRR